MLSLQDTIKSEEKLVYVTNVLRELSSEQKENGNNALFYTLEYLRDILMEVRHPLIQSIEKERNKKESTKGYGKKG